MCRGDVESDNDLNIASTADFRFSWITGSQTSTQKSDSVGFPLPFEQILKTLIVTAESDFN